MTATALPVHATEGETFSGSVASFHDTDASAAAADFTATIDWGDGESSAGTVSETAGGAFVISGSHVYAHEVSAHSTKAIIAQNGGDTATVSATGSVADAPIELAPGAISTPLGRVVEGLVVAILSTRGTKPRRSSRPRSIGEMEVVPPHPSPNQMGSSNSLAATAMPTQGSTRSELP